MKHFIVVFISAILFGSFAHAGFGGEYLLSSIGGKAPSEMERANSLVKVVELDSNRIRIVFAGSLWDEDTRTGVFVYNCSRGICERDPIDNWARLTVIQKSNGNLVITSGKVVFVLDRISTDENPSSGSPWAVKETVDSSGKRTFAAYKKDDSNGATLVLSCDPITTKIGWSIHLSEKTYLAAQGNVIVGKGSLRTVGNINSVNYQDDHWVLAANNYVVNTEPVSKYFLEDLKKASNFQLNLIGVKTDRTNIKLETMNFTLNGSAKAISDLQLRCSGDSSDLPVPLP